MGDKTGIEWTDATWNPLSGCAHVSPGCDNCYAASLVATRLAHVPAYEGLAFDGKFTGEIRLLPERLDQPLRWKRPRRIFVNSMSDLFHKDVPDDFIERVWQVMERCPQHQFQVLTKRPQRMATWVLDRAARVVGGTPPVNPVGYQNADGTLEVLPQPLPPAAVLPNVWLGTSIESQTYAFRAHHLMATPAAVRFLSIEPLLGPVDLAEWMPPGRVRWQCSGCRGFFAGELRRLCPGCGRVGYWTGSHVGNGRPNGQPLDWVIVGGESGRDARPMRAEWARGLRDQCVAAGVPFLFKQAGTVLAKEWGCTNKKGADLAEIPEEFHVRQYPV